ncbi:2-oxo acid dehydrogenase subunit E2 [Acinetobacter rudis]|uniref:Dihydrolipoamide acetyltransferase component of pyruvate dehydrogenase complex n=1 Tax=Acinetobacter rudis CIP 110305 TaxID=421052 RepID=S3NPM1_9GAMM|nr:2-oxo acid dehydrogenase subunit E2 [Acinetobacter rudis]EPF81562.1 dihydrolipoyllysine-residue acetyltransferase [Acinetobacter rudis CIP 110305]
MQIKTPDIGVDQATVAEILVKVGDRIALEDSIVLLESDKASVEVPSTAEGVVTKVLVQVGDSVAQDAVLIEVDSDAAEVAAPAPATAAEKSNTAAEPVTEEKPAAAPTQTGSSQTVELKVPDIGVEKALIAEILVQVGDQVNIDDSLVVVESDKASVEVPSTVAGVIESIVVKSGDTVKEGVVLMTVKTVATTAETPATTTAPASTPAAASTSATAAPSASGAVEVSVPDLGVDKATVSEILVKVGEQVEAQQSLCVVESDKASVEVPSTVAGTITAIHVEVGQAVQQGIALVTIESTQSTPAVKAAAAPANKAEAAPSAATTPSSAPTEQPQSTATTEKLTQAQQAENAKVYAGPAVRKLARELGVVLSQVQSSGPHARVVKEDVYAFVKSQLTAAKSAPATTVAVASGLPALPDFSAFGGGEVKTMTRLQQVSVPQLSLNNFIPQVTQFDAADISELEAWRNELKANFKKQGVSLTILAFIAKAVAHLLKEEPYFAGHLADDQKSVLLRNEIHMGIAVATPDGLTVPVLRNPDQKSIKQIAIELGELSQKARDKKLSPKDLQGANFTITSLGSIGGTAFTPLVNWPQVAILGISPATMQPVWNGESFDPRLMLPLSLSYDHRVINGADAARFTNKLTKLLADIRNILL